MGIASVSMDSVSSTGTVPERTGECQDRLRFIMVSLPRKKQHVFQGKIIPNPIERSVTFCVDDYLYTKTTSTVTCLDGDDDSSFGNMDVPVE